MTITQSTAVQAGAQDASSPARTPTSPKAPSTSAIVDTVRISAAAQSALQEAAETPTQTAQEAQHGDRQAQRLLAKEAAEKAGQ